MTAIPKTIARTTSYILAGMLIVSALWPVDNWLPPRLFAVGQLVAGVGILYGRNWAYYLTYVMAIAHLLVLLAPALFRSLPSFVPFAVQVALALKFIGVPLLFTITMLNLLFVGALAWIQWSLRGSGWLNYPLASVHKRRWLRAFQILNALAVVATIPILALAAYMLTNPPPSSPGSMGGGFVAVIALVYGIPIAVLGLVGFFVTRLILVGMDRADS